MRPTLVRWLSLTLCCLAAACWGCAVKQKAAATQKVPVNKKAEPLTWTVQGWGKTEEAAKEHALKNAREKVIDHLQSLQPPLIWAPSLDDIRKNVPLGQPKSCPDQDTMVEGEHMECWSWTAQLSGYHLDNMRREDAKYRAQLGVQDRMAASEDRMQGLSKLVGVLVIALAGVWLFGKVAQTTRRKTATDETRMEHG